MVFCLFFCVFFFKQKTAYEMRISDWSSDVCSSDLMKPRIYWAPPYVAALIMGALSFPGLVSALTLEQALSVAEQDAPSLHAQAANLVAARSAAIPAGELPDPKLKLGLQSVPIEGADRWQLEQEARSEALLVGKE